MRKILVCGGHVVKHEDCLKRFAHRDFCPFAFQDGDEPGSTDDAAGRCHTIAIEYIPAAPVARLVEAAKNIRAYCLPGMNWSDDTATAMLRDFDEALAAVEEAMKG